MMPIIVDTNGSRAFKNQAKQKASDRRPDLDKLISFSFRNRILKHLYWVFSLVSESDKWSNKVDFKFHS